MRYDLARGFDDFRAVQVPAPPQQRNGCVFVVSAVGFVAGTVMAVEAPTPYDQLGSRLASASVELGIRALRGLANRAA